MATIREYYETDFNNAIRLHIKIPFEQYKIESCILYDFTAYCSFVASYFIFRHRSQALTGKIFRPSPPGEPVLSSQTPVRWVFSMKFSPRYR